MHLLPVIEVTEPLGIRPRAITGERVRGLYGFVACLPELVDKFILTREQERAISAQSRRYSASDAHGRECRQ
jgi:hypothetical protein